MKYSKLLVDEDSRLIHLGCNIGDEVAQELTMALNDLMGKKKPIGLIIHSLGGDVASAIACYDAIRLCSVPVNGLVIGDCLSAALLVFMACDSRALSVNSRVQLHNGTAGVGRVASQDLLKEAHEESRLMDLFDALLAEQSGNTVEVIKRWSDKCSYISAKEAVSLGFGNQVVTPKPKKVSRARRRRA